MGGKWEEEKNKIPILEKRIATLTGEIESLKKDITGGVPRTWGLWNRGVAQEKEAARVSSLEKEIEAKTKEIEREDKKLKAREELVFKLEERRGAREADTVAAERKHAEMVNEGREIEGPYSQAKHREDVSAHADVDLKESKTIKIQIIFYCLYFKSSYYN